MSGPLLGIDVFEDIADVAEVVALAELIQDLREKVQDVKVRNSLSPPSRKQTPHIGSEQFYLDDDTVSDRRGILSKVMEGPERASVDEDELHSLDDSPSPDGP